MLKQGLKFPISNLRPDAELATHGLGGAEVRFLRKFQKHRAMARMGSQFRTPQIEQTAISSEGAHQQAMWSLSQSAFERSVVEWSLQDVMKI